MSEFIVCENLVKIYKLMGVEVQALQGLDLTVHKGELLGIVGASGSGKSTLLNVLGGLDRPTGGRVTVGDQDLLSLSDHGLDTYRRETVGFVWQMGARNLIPYLNAVENVELPLILGGLSGRRARARATALIERVGLVERKHHYLHQLSGGEAQRVGIATALVNSPQLILADEPTGEVDTATANSLYTLFRDLNRELGVTILIVSHDPNLARHVDRVVAVRDGKLAAEYTRKEPHPSASSQDANALKIHDEHFHEALLLDSAGRLQIPREVLRHFNIHRRAQMDVTEEGILIRPIPEQRQPPREAAAGASVTSPGLTTDQSRSPGADPQGLREKSSYRSTYWTRIFTWFRQKAHRDNSQGGDR